MAAVPIYVAPYSATTAERGTTDGVAAVAEARAQGFSAGPIVLDVEPEVFAWSPADTLSYVASWSSVVHKSGFSDWGYGTSVFLDAVAQSDASAKFDAVWLAWYQDLSGLPDPHATLLHAGGAWSNPGQRLRQWVGTTTLAPAPTMQVDLTSADAQVSRWLRRSSNCE